jgi:peptide/nickel transport system substrate-binding protein
MLGWTPTTYDAHNALNLMADDDKGPRPVQPRQLLQSESRRTDGQDPVRDRQAAKRNAMIAEAFNLHADDVGHLPLHQQALAWGVRKNVDLVQLADNFMPFPLSDRIRSERPFMTRSLEVLVLRSGLK